MPQTPLNNLCNETSLYLQQHAHNPVNWYPWGKEAFDRAKKENKLVLISIGYSSCHWCHVMEKETFMDTASARIMNENYICIKVDREERPDIDQVYMSAVQMMTGSGGWPLNCFALPDGKPIYGGTYFPKNTWMDMLIKLRDFYRDNRDKAIQYAEELTQGISQSELITTVKEQSSFSFETVQHAVGLWKSSLDNLNGGPQRTPKFPLPVNYSFLLRYATETNDMALRNHVELTLNKMAFGGIYDQVSGGFARYSTDSLWKVPHFEKMLYDNSQMISLYSSAYKLTHNQLYKDVALETLKFLNEEMSDKTGSYYSSIDADSEGEEGKYYVWNAEQLKKLKLPPCGQADGFEVLKDYFNINERGYWEKNNFILLRYDKDEDVAARHHVSVDELKKFIAASRVIMSAERSKRESPVLDKKIITSWNALQISALCDAYQAFGDEKLRVSALKSANSLIKNSVNSRGEISHLGNHQKNNSEGYLDDYAFTISALIDLYQITFDISWLERAKEFTDAAIRNYYDKKAGFFWYNSDLDAELITRKKETIDNVISSSNSEMANALFILGDLYEEKNYTAIATSMLNTIEENIIRYPSSYSNWLNLMMNYSKSFNEIVITGENADEERKNISKQYLPFAVLAGNSNGSAGLPVLEGRFRKDKTQIFICRNRTCKLPVESSIEAIAALKSDLRFP